MFGSLEETHLTSKQHTLLFSNYKNIIKIYTIFIAPYI